MAVKSLATLRADIIAAIATNTTGAITGNILQTQLVGLLDSLNAAGASNDLIWGLSTPAPWQIASSAKSYFVVEYAPKWNGGSIMACPYTLGKPGTSLPTGAICLGDFYNSPNGSLSLVTGTLSNGWALATIYGHNAYGTGWGVYNWTTGKRFAAWGIYAIPILADGTETYEFTMAWDDAGVGGVKAVYNTSGIAIRITTSSGVATESAYVAAPSAATIFRLGLTGTVGGTVSLYLNGVVVATLSSGWGTQPARISPANLIQKSLGTTTRRINVYQLGHALEY